MMDMKLTSDVSGLNRGSPSLLRASRHDCWQGPLLVDSIFYAITTTVLYFVLKKEQVLYMFRDAQMSRLVIGTWKD